jgi:hypothetical protein
MRKEKEYCMRKTQPSRQALESGLEDLFVFCILSDEDNRGGSSWFTKDKVCPRDFPEAEAFFCVDDSRYVGIAKNEQSVSYFRDVAPHDVPRFDASSVKSFQGEDGTNYIEFYRLHSEPLRAARGHKLFSPHVASLYSCWLNADQGKYHGRRVLVNKAGSDWVPVGACGEYDRFTKDKTLSGQFTTWICEDDSQITDTCQVLLGLAFTRDVTWRVVFKGPSGISVSISTDTAGAMAAFKNRQPNATTGRRDALRHWVRQHYRTKAADEGEEPQRVIVREHLRGRTPFRWFGLDCELVVSPFDMRRNERFKAERKSLVTA